MIYSVKLLAKKDIAEKTTAFFFEKPRGFKFVPGQFIEIHLAKKIYAFSIASAPKEKDLMIATRMRPSPFKNALKKLKTGESLKIDGPFGRFTLHKNKRIPAIFLASGIGITPFRSMIKSFPGRKITLFYSNRKTKDAAFLEELKNLETKNLKLIATMTKENGKRINPKMIKENSKDRGRAIYYITGSSGFVQSMADLLAKMKIKSKNIKTENFTGY